jgi:hypothetical protein
MGMPWKVASNLNDDDPVPDPPRGGQPEDDIPTDQRVTPLRADADVRSVIASHPPINPFMRRRWVEAGLLEREDPSDRKPESDHTEWGAS